jgi:hypothetical protein
MSLEKKKASAAANGPDALEIVAHSPAINGFETNNSLIEVQQNFLARRFRLAPGLAQLVAELAFVRRAA